MVDLGKSVCFPFWGNSADDSSSVFTVLMTHKHRENWDDFCGAPVLTTVDVLSFRLSNTSCLLNRFRFVDVFVTRMKNGWLRKASTMSFADTHPCVTRLGTESKCRRPFASVVIMMGVTERGSSSFRLATQIVFECLLVDIWSCFASKWVFTFASYVFIL